MENINSPGSDSEEETQYYSDAYEDLYQSGGSEDEMGQENRGQREVAGIQPYRFEPEARVGEANRGDLDGEEDDENTEEDRLGNTQWSVWLQDKMYTLKLLNIQLVKGTESAILDYSNLFQHIMNDTTI